MILGYWFEQLKNKMIIRKPWASYFRRVATLGGTGRVSRRFRYLFRVAAMFLTASFGVSLLFDRDAFFQASKGPPQLICFNVKHQIKHVKDIFIAN